MPKTPEELAAEQESRDERNESERSSASEDAGTRAGRGAPPSHLPEDVGRRRRDAPGREQP